MKPEMTQSLHLTPSIPMLGFQALLQFLLTQHGVFPPQGLLKARLGLQRLLVTQNGVVVFPEHLELKSMKKREELRLCITKFHFLAFCAD